MKNALIAGAALLGAAACAAPAQASIILSLKSVQAVNGGEDYTYQVTLSQDEQLKNADGPAFFDLYDFGAGKLVSETGDMKSGWTFANEIITPNQYAQQEQPFNEPGVLGLRFVYSGPTITGPSIGNSQGNLGTFTVFTTFTGGYQVFLNDQDAQLAKYAPGQVGNNTVTSNLAAVAVPDVIGQVPEPASIALLAAGVIGMCAFGYRRGPKNMPSRIG